MINQPLHLQPDVDQGGDVEFPAFAAIATLGGGDRRRVAPRGGERVAVVTAARDMLKRQVVRIIAGEFSLFSEPVIRFLRKSMKVNVAA